MDTYWEVYVAYLDKCVRENWENDIDPAHYDMQWNHFLPRCIFGDLPIGQWLTLRQHAIATALQTLAFKRNCMYGGQKKFLPKELLNLAWPYYCESSSIRMTKTNLEAGVAAENGRKTMRIVHSVKNEAGKSVQGVKNAKRLHKEKDELGRSVTAMKVNSQQWMCLVTKHISNSGGLSAYQNKRGIDTSLRVRVG